MHWTGLGVRQFEGYAISAQFANTSAYPAFTADSKNPREYKFSRVFMA